MQDQLQVLQDLLKIQFEWNNEKTSIQKESLDLLINPF